LAPQTPTKQNPRSRQIKELLDSEKPETDEEADVLVRSQKPNHKNFWVSPSQDLAQSKRIFQEVLNGAFCTDRQVPVINQNSDGSLKLNYEEFSLKELVSPELSSRLKELAKKLQNAGFKYQMNHNGELTETDCEQTISAAERQEAIKEGIEQGRIKSFVEQEEERERQRQRAKLVPTLRKRIQPSVELLTSKLVLANIQRKHCATITA